MIAVMDNTQFTQVVMVPDEVSTIAAEVGVGHACCNKKTSCIVNQGLALHTLWLKIACSTTIQPKHKLVLNAGVQHVRVP